MDEYEITLRCKWCGSTFKLPCGQHMFRWYEKAPHNTKVFHGKNQVRCVYCNSKWLMFNDYYEKNKGKNLKIEGKFYSD